MKLIKFTSIEIMPTAPFKFDATFHKPDHFTSGDNYWEKGTRWQTMFHNGRKLGLVINNTGTVNKPCITVLVHGNDSLSKDYLEGLKSELVFRFNLDFDLSNFYRKFASDTHLGPVIKKWKGMRPGHPSSLYEYLIVGVVLQNATVKRSMQMFTALLEKYGTLLEYDNKKLWCFWKPGKLSKVIEGELRALKVGYRAKTIKRIDEHFAKGEIDELKLRNTSLEAQREELLKLYGVGPATVWYLLFDVFHHWDHFDHISPWEQKIYSKVFFDKDPEKPVAIPKLLAHFNKYKPYQHLAVHYIWEDLWWSRKNEKIEWLEKLIRV